MTPEALATLNLVITVLLALVAVGEARGWEAEAAARDAARSYRERLLAAEGADVAPAEGR